MAGRADKDSMQHVREIRQFIEEGDAPAAHAALERLLTLGPKNTEALKLRALLFEQEGRFDDEARVWEQIARVDRQDDELHAFIQRRQMEERDNFYFTEELVGGGRCFMAFPRALFRTCLFGFFGCLAFLILAQAIQRFPELQQQQSLALLGMFTVCVMAPWGGIIYVFLMMLRSVSVHRAGVEIATRTRRVTIPWPAIDKIYVAHDYSDANPKLSLVIVPKDAAEPVYEIDLRRDSSSIRARSYLLKEITRNFGEPFYAAFPDLAKLELPRHPRTYHY